MPASDPGEPRVSEDGFPSVGPDGEDALVGHARRLRPADAREITGVLDRAAVDEGEGCRGIAAGRDAIEDVLRRPWVSHRERGDRYCE